MNPGRPSGVAFLLSMLLFLGLYSCKKEAADAPLFAALTADKTGLQFTNQLTPTARFNMFNYMYFYNGAGVGAGDFNNDGKIDLFFASNQGQNKLYLNSGKLQFKDVTAAAHIPNDGGWSTGVSVVDINNDGLLDIYVCRVGNYEVLKSKNQLLVCGGIDKYGVPYYTDEAAAYGIDFSGFSTQAAFFDYDGDGDLDLFLLNHSVHQNGTFAERKHFLGTYHPLSGDRLYRNDGTAFTDVTKAAQINSSAISYGLGMAVSDIDLDGYPDLYVGNDFHENDYLYINQHNGTFSEQLTERIMHTSQFSMGVDVADINNDAYPDVVSMDMLPSDPYILKRSLGEDAYNIFYLKINYGYNYQYARNNLQLNRRNGMFSETGLYSGIYASDWSWSALWMDFDNDGLKDLFVSNGIPKRLNDMDYVNYVSNTEVQQKIRNQSLNDKDMAVINKFPEIKLPNRFFKNTGNAVFEDIGSQVAGNEDSFSNGAVYADLDGDGDLDVVVNNINEPVVVYQNRSNDDSSKPALSLNLQGPPANIHALGAKVIVYAGAGVRTYEKYGVRGFQSSTEVPLSIGLAHTKIDSMVLVWPDNTCQPLTLAPNTYQMTVTYRPGLPRFDYTTLRNRYPNTTRPVQDITPQTGLAYAHTENPFVEFDRETLIPKMVSREGPALAVGDCNGDGREDVYIGSAKGKRSALFLQQPNGKFIRSTPPAFEADSMYEEVDAKWVDVNRDGAMDLVVASGGNEYYGRDEHLMPRVYTGDGQGHFTRLAGAFTNIYLTASCVAPCDVNGDGYPDLFVGGRAVPWAYGQLPQSYLLLNDGQGHFSDATARYSPDLSGAGMVTDAVWHDMDSDGDSDLVLATEWGGIIAFMNDKGHLQKTYLTTKRGWWNFILPYDVDGDGDVDIVAGNLGLNSRLKATPAEPVRLYYNDFDDNGKAEQLLTYYLNGREIPFANKDELQKQVPLLKKRFLYAADFAKATLEDLFTAEKLKSAQVLMADYLENAILINDGHMHYTVQPMPWQAQLSPYKAAAIVNANNDSLPDILLAGNFYENNIQMSRYDADFGSLLVNKGGGRFAYQSLNGLTIKGQVRRISPVQLGKQTAYILARNNDSTMVIQFKEPHQ